MPVSAYPPFPDNVPTHSLVIIDYKLIKTRDSIEIERLWEAATSLEIDFRSLKNHGTDKEVNDMFDLSAKYMALPLDEKMEFTQGHDGYKCLGSNQIEASGVRDSNEIFNISQDDAFSYPSITHRTYPTLINNAMRGVIIPFTRKSVEVTKTLIDVFNGKLGLAPDELGKRHSMTEHSKNETRFIRVPPNLNMSRKALGHHTDFGSLPIPGHAICNIGDALHILSGGILRSNIHRVLSPPGDQSTFERYSIVFFLRPGNSVLLGALSKESSLIRAAVDHAVEPKKFNTGTTAGEWHSRRVKYRRAVNLQKDQQLWAAGQGTEGKVY
ncbi:hypothetical protein Clacol_003166 [Clathrus columnatus]|uniref:Clavaminate synthase-like protein n=1 Tax=Clathrus columnatus TaxID=1419009 RepID=A0AAV5A8Q9_9AGAM|nr:hypothetical protein Clacol_003166 [Clathrus columnatus]